MQYTPRRVGAPSEAMRETQATSAYLHAISTKRAQARLRRLCANRNLDSSSTRGSHVHATTGAPCNRAAWPKRPRETTAARLARNTNVGPRKWGPFPRGVQESLTTFSKPNWARRARGRLEGRTLCTAEGEGGIRLQTRSTVHYHFHFHFHFYEDTRRVASSFSAVGSCHVCRRA